MELGSPLSKLEPHGASPPSVQTPAQAEQEEVASPKPAEALKVPNQIAGKDSPKLSKLGKVASLLSGFVLGVGVGALTAGLVSNPVGWAILGLGALTVGVVLLYQKSQGTGGEALKWAARGVLLGAAAAYLAAAGVLAGASALAVKGASAVATFAQTTVFPALQSIATQAAPFCIQSAGTLIPAGATLGVLLTGAALGRFYRGKEVADKKPEQT